MSIATIINGDARRLPLADGSVHCVVTSPPYFGLRDYGTAAWEGGDEGCDHVERRRPQSLAALADRMAPRKNPRNPNRQDDDQINAIPYRDLCGKCGARRVDRQIGLEATPDAFVATMVAVFREVKRVLRDDGTAWVNLGDSYSSTPGKNNENLVQWSADNARGGGHRAGSLETPMRLTPQGLGPKQLLMMPHRVALALQADGWIVRSDIVWAKPNPMPESVTDRPTKSHEYVFLLSKRERYFYDADAVREAQADAARGQGDPSLIGGTWDIGEDTNDARLIEGKNTRFRKMDRGADRVYNPSGRNLRSVWTIPTHAWPGSHFATFPPELVRRCVKAGTSEKGCCPSCGAGWERVVEELPEYREWAKTQRFYGAGGNGSAFHEAGTNSAVAPPKNRQLGFRPSCSCPDHAPIPCIVLDPFAGSGTTGVVATGLNRRFVGVDLSPDYCRMAVRRISRPHASHRTARDTGDLPLFAGVE